MPPPLPPPLPPSPLQPELPGRAAPAPPFDVRYAALEPVPIVMVPVALISNAPPPAPGLELALDALLSPPLAPEQPPRSGSRSVSVLAAPAGPDVLVVLL